MKKLIVLLAALFVFDVTTQSLADVISSVADLQALCNTPGDYDKHFILTADLDCSGAALSPIGNASIPFTGVFDGNGHVLRNVDIEEPDRDYVGLFGFIGNGGQVMNLGIDGGFIRGCPSGCSGISGYTNVGALAGRNSGTITGCYSNVSVEGHATVNGSSFVGGLTGENTGSIAKCYAVGSVSSSLGGGGLVAITGGLVGRNSGTITSCYSAGTVGPYYLLGGLVGSNSGTVTACFWDMDTSGRTSSAAGVGKTTTEMSLISTFVDAGWDFGNTWCMPQGHYPRLQWQPWFGYVCTAYGDWGWRTKTQIVQNGSAHVEGPVADTGYQEVDVALSMNTQADPFQVRGTIYIYGLDGEWDMPGYPQESCGKAYGKVKGLFMPSRYPAGTSMLLDLSASGSGYHGDAEDFYFKILNGQSVLAELNSQKMNNTIVVKAGDKLTFEMYAMEEDFAPSSFGSPSYNRTIVFTCTEGAQGTDSTNPELEITTNGGNNYETYKSQVIISGTAFDPSPASGVEAVSINTGDTNEGTLSNWQFTVDLVEGENTLTIAAQDHSGNISESTIVVTYRIPITVYVDDVTDPLEDGSFEHPFDKIQEAIDAASNGDKIIVNEGMYRENLVIDNLDVTLSGSDPDNGVTVIDGNSLDSVIKITDSNSVLEGFTITNGLSGADTGGGGIYCRNSSLVISNCEITGNKTADAGAGNSSCDGGGIYALSSVLEIKNCEIGWNETGRGGRDIGNDAGDSGSGAGIYCSSSSLTIKDCDITGNLTGYGGNGRDYNGADSGSSGSGGGIYCHAGSVNIERCRIIGNKSGNGGRISEIYGYSIDTFGGHSGNGAGICCVDSDILTLIDCEISENTVGNSGSGIGLDGTMGGNSGSGGGVYLSSSNSIEISRCSFTGNKVGDCGGGQLGGDGGSGGGLYCSSPVSVDIINCEFLNNKAGNGGYGRSHGGSGGDGGGIAIISPYACLTDCRLVGNRAGDGKPEAIPASEAGFGGGLYCSGDLTSLNCLITGNSSGTSIAGGSGGGIYTGSTVTLINCTIAGNTANTGIDEDGKGGGIYSETSSEIRNTILWNNFAGQMIDESAQLDGGTHILNYSCVQGWTGGLGGLANIGSDPLFLDPDNDDFHLKSEYGHWDAVSRDWVYGTVTSPCIDGGDPCSVWAAEPQPNGNRINMGAYGGTPKASMSPSFSLAGWWRFNETGGTNASDSSVYDNEGIVINGPVWNYGSLSFDGIDDYVEVADSNSLDIQDGLTISAWIYMDQYSTDWPKLVIKPYDSADTDPWELYVLDLGHYGTYPRFILRDGEPGGSSVYAYDSSYTLSLSKWHHIAGTYDGSVTSLYIDGVLVNSMSGTIQIGTNNLPLSIGGRMGHRSFKGLMDDIRIYNRGLTETEIVNLYDRMLPSFSLVGCWEFNETSGTEASDLSGYGNAGILVNGPVWRSDGSLSFDGIDDYVQVADSPSLDIQDELTISAWIYMDQYSTDWPKLVIKPYDSAGSDPWELYTLDLGHYGTYPRFIITDGIPGGHSVYALDSSYTLSLSKWHHIVGTYDGSVTSLYIDGVLVNSMSGTVQIGTNNLPLSIGGRMEHNGFKGSIDNVKIYNRGLTESEVVKLYNSMQPSFPLIGWWEFKKLSGTEISDSSGCGNPGMLINGPVWRGDGSLSFDGIDDYMEVADSSSLDIQDELTISVWIYMDQYSTDWPKLVIKPYDSAGSDPWELYTLDLGHYGTYPRFIITDGIPGGNSVYALDSSYTLSLSKWHHIVGTYDGSAASLYIDGVLVNSMNGTIQIGTNNLPLSIGGRMGHHSFNGLIDEVRIYNRGLTESEVVNLYNNYGNGTESMITVPGGWFAYQNAPLGSHTFVDSFSISKYEITLSQYCRFLNAADPDGIYWHKRQTISRKGEPGNYYYVLKSGRENYPVSFVSIHDCRAYAAWKSSVTGLNYRLPTEQEWEKAAGWDPVLQKLWTYGFQQDKISCNWCNYNYCVAMLREAGYYDGVNPGTIDAKSYYGCYDMTGNLGEWTSSIYSGSNHVVRGGSWGGYSTHCEVTNRYSLPSSSERYTTMGFRLVLDY